MPQGPEAAGAAWPAASCWSNKCWPAACPRRQEQDCTLHTPASPASILRTVQEAKKRTGWSWEQLCRVALAGSNTPPGARSCVPSRTHLDHPCLLNNELALLVLLRLLECVLLRAFQAQRAQGSQGRAPGCAVHPHRQNPSSLGVLTYFQPRTVLQQVQ